MHGGVILALRQYPQGGATSRQSHHPVIADLIRNPEGAVQGARHTGFKAVSTGGKVTRVKQDKTNHHLSHGQPTMAAHMTTCTQTNPLLPPTNTP